LTTSKFLIQRLKERGFANTRPSLVALTEGGHDCVDTTEGGISRCQTPLSRHESDASSDQHPSDYVSTCTSSSLESHLAGTPTKSGKAESGLNTLTSPQFPAGLVSKLAFDQVSGEYNLIMSKKYRKADMPPAGMSDTTRIYTSEEYDCPLLIVVKYLQAKESIGTAQKGIPGSGSAVGLFTAVLKPELLPVKPATNPRICVAAPGDFTFRSSPESLGKKEEVVEISKFTPLLNAKVNAVSTATSSGLEESSKVLSPALELTQSKESKESKKHKKHKKSKKKAMPTESVVTAKQQSFVTNMKAKALTRKTKG
jgi:hypothetical protein